MEKIGEAIVFMCIVSVLFFFGIYKTITYFFIEEKIESTVLIEPEVKIIVKDNVIDTIYVYKPNE